MWGILEGSYDFDASKKCEKKSEKNNSFIVAVIGKILFLIFVFDCD